MHKEELKDEVKDLFGGFTEGEYLNYFTSRFPRLLVHCYNAVEKEARDLLPEYFHEYASAQASTAAIGTRGLEFEGSKLTINCNDVITFPEKKVEIDTLKIKHISHLFIEQNKLFTNFLQRNASNVTQLEFFEGSLKFDSMNKILQKFPNLKKIEFVFVNCETSKTNQKIQQATCHNLVELEILSLRNSNLLKPFLECKSIIKLKVNYFEVTLEEFLQIYPNLEVFNVHVDDEYPVSDQHEANATIHQLKVLRITLDTDDEKIQEKLISSILKQNNLQQFNFRNYNFFNPSQSFCQQLAAHICQLERLTKLMIYNGKLLNEVEVFVAKIRMVWITRLEEFGCQLRHVKSLPSSFLAHFTNLRELNIECFKTEETKVEDLISFMNKSQLTSIKLGWLPSASFQLLQHLQVDSLQLMEITIDNEYQEKVPAFDILQEFLPKNPNITQFQISFKKDYDEPKSLELIPMILTTLPQLEILVVLNYSKITPGGIKQIAALKTLKSWWINEYKSVTFYKI